MADGNLIASTLGAAGGLAGLGGLIKAITVDRHSATRSEIEILEARTAGYRRELDEVRARLDECRRREIDQGVELVHMRRQIEDLNRRYPR